MTLPSLAFAILLFLIALGLLRIRPGYPGFAWMFIAAAALVLLPLPFKWLLVLIWVLLLIAVVKVQPGRGKRFAMNFLLLLVALSAATFVLGHTGTEVPLHLQWTGKTVHLHFPITFEGVQVHAPVTLDPPPPTTTPLSAGT